MPKRKHSSVTVSRGVSGKLWAVLLTFTLASGAGAYIYFNGLPVIGPPPPPPNSVQLTFSQIGLDSTATGIVLTVNGVSKYFLALPYILSVTQGTSVSYLYSSTIQSSQGTEFSLNGNPMPASPFSANASITITAQYVNTGLSFKTHPQTVTYTWLDPTPAPFADGYGRQSPAQILSDLQDMQSLGFTVVNGWDHRSEFTSAEGSFGSYALSTFADDCQNLGIYWMYVTVPPVENGPFAYTPSSAFGTHLQAIANYYKSNPYLIGIYFDDYYPPNQVGDSVAFDDFVRTNFNIGRPIFTFYAMAANLMTPELRGKTGVAIACANPVSSGYDDPYGTHWLQTFFNKYGDLAAQPQYTIGPALDCAGGGGTDMSSAWDAQVTYCINNQMLTYWWYCYKRVNDFYGDGFYNNPSWRAIIKSENQRILTFLTS